MPVPKLPTCLRSIMNKVTGSHVGVHESMEIWTVIMNPSETDAWNFAELEYFSHALRDTNHTAPGINLVGVSPGQSQFSPKIGG